MDHRQLWFRVLLLQILLACVGLATAQTFGRSRRDDDNNEKDGTFGEGVVEEYILAREAVEYELEEFYKTASGDMEPDRGSDAWEALRATRELMLKEFQKESLPPAELLDLLEGDPGMPDISGVTA